MERFADSALHANIDQLAAIQHSACRDRALGPALIDARYRDF